MLKIRDYKNYWDKYRNIIPELDHVVLVASESGLAKKTSELKKSRFILAVVLPSADLNASNADAAKFDYDGIILALAPADQGATEDKFIDNIDICGNIIQTILETLSEDITGGTCNIIKELDLNSVKIDPEVNYLSCNGYSMSFKFNYPA
jgi:hypothetical protein